MNSREADFESSMYSREEETDGMIHLLRKNNHHPITDRNRHMTFSISLLLATLLAVCTLVVAPT